MFLSNVADMNLAGKRVLMRADLDVDNPNLDDQRLKSSADTILYLLQRNTSVVVLGHRGRPDGNINNKFSLKPVCDALSGILGKEIKFIFDIAGAESQNEAGKLFPGQIMMIENLRFDSREEQNDEELAKNLSLLGNFYVNEAFASSHRNHTSVVALPKEFKSRSKNSVALGLRFEKEMKNLARVFESPNRPVLFIISGLKEDKLRYVSSFEPLADKILIGGRLPEFYGDKALESVRTQNGKVIVGNLIMDKADITLNTIDLFEKEIKTAGTIVVSGPLGKFEEEGYRQGTERVFKAVVESRGYRVAGGGDTEDALRLFNFQDKFDWVSVGGGAMLEFLANKTLPGIETIG